MSRLSLKADIFQWASKYSALEAVNKVAIQTERFYRNLF